MKHHVIAILLTVGIVGWNETISSGTDRSSPRFELFGYGYGHTAKCDHEGGQLQNYIFKDKAPITIFCFEVSYLKYTDYKSLIIVEKKKKSSVFVGKLDSFIATVAFLTLVALATSNRIACNHRQVSIRF